MNSLKKLLSSNYIDIVIILTVAIVTRLKNITKDDLWFDEAFIGLLMRADKSSFLKEITNDVHPPLYAFINKGWSLLFGVSDFTLRLLPLVFGVFTVFLIYITVKKLFTKEIGAIAAFLAAINPFLITYSIEARSYTFFGFVILLAVYFLITRKYWLFTFTVIAALATHYMTFAFLPPLMGYYAFSNRKTLLKELPKLALIGAIAAGLFMRGNQSNNDLNIGWARPSELTNIQRSITAYSFGVKARLAGSDALNDLSFILDTTSLGTIIFIALVVGVTILIYKTKDNPAQTEKVVFLIAMTVIPQLVVIFYGIVTNKSIYVERYLLPSAIFYLMVTAVVLGKLVRFETMGIMVVLYIVTLLRISSPGYYEGMKLLAKRFSGRNEAIVFTSPIEFVVGKYYVQDAEVKLYDPQNPYEDFSGWPFIEPEDQIVVGNPKYSVFIAADEGKMADEFYQPDSELKFGNYKLFVKKN